MPDDFAAFGHPVDDHVERRGFDAGLQSTGRYPTFFQREIVGEHLDPGLHKFGKTLCERPGTRREHAILYQIKDYLVPLGGEPARQVVTKADIVRLERITGLDKHIFGHFLHLPPTRD